MLEHKSRPFRHWRLRDLDDLVSEFGIDLAGQLRRPHGLGNVLFAERVVDVDLRPGRKKDGGVLPVKLGGAAHVVGDGDPDQPAVPHKLGDAAVEEHRASVSSDVRS
jgi:hypothetical protein